MNRAGGAYVEDYGQDDGAEDEAEIHIHGVGSRAVRRRVKRERDEIKSSDGVWRE